MDHCNLPLFGIVANCGNHSSNSNTQSEGQSVERFQVHRCSDLHISSIVLVTRAVALFGVNYLLNVTEAIFSGGIIIVSTAFLSFVFIPKVSIKTLYSFNYAFCTCRW